MDESIATKVAPPLKLDSAVAGWRWGLTEGFQYLAICGVIKSAPPAFKDVFLIAEVKGHAVVAVTPDAIKVTIKVVSI